MMQRSEKLGRLNFPKSSKTLVARYFFEHYGSRLKWLNMREILDKTEGNLRENCRKSKRNLRVEYLKELLEIEIFLRIS